MAAVPSFELSVLERICDVLADTSAGLTGTQIGKLLSQLGIHDPMPGMTKRIRLFEALKQRQEQDRCANLVVAFIQETMKPVRHTGSPGWFDSTREELNKILAFAGYELSEAGAVVIRAPVKTLSEAQRRANRLRGDLEKRGVHHDVLRSCRAELLQENYFHVVGVWGATEQKTGLSTGCRQPLDRRDVNIERLWRGPLHTCPRPAG